MVVAESDVHEVHVARHFLLLDQARAAHDALEGSLLALHEHGHVGTLLPGLQLRQQLLLGQVLANVAEDVSPVLASVHQEGRRLGFLIRIIEPAGDDLIRPGSVRLLAFHLCLLDLILGRLVSPSFILACAALEVEGLQRWLGLSADGVDGHRLYALRLVGLLRDYLLLLLLHLLHLVAFEQRTLQELLLLESAAFVIVFVLLTKLCHLLFLFQPGGFPPGFLLFSGFLGCFGPLLFFFQTSSLLGLSLLLCKQLCL